MGKMKDALFLPNEFCCRPQTMSKDKREQHQQQGYNMHMLQFMTITIMNRSGMLLSLIESKRIQLFSFDKYTRNNKASSACRLVDRQKWCRPGQRQQQSTLSRNSQAMRSVLWVTQVHKQQARQDEKGGKYEWAANTISWEWQEIEDTRLTTASSLGD